MSGSVVIRCNVLCGNRASVVSWDVKLGLSLESYVDDKTRSFGLS